MSLDPVVITGIARTPMGGFLGDLSAVTAPQLGIAAIKAALNDAKLGHEHIDEVIMGCVLPAGQGQAPARQAALGAGLPNAVHCTTINKMCGSGMQAVIMAHHALLAGSGEIFVSGGMESMSNAPYLLPKARTGYRMGNNTIYDHMMIDGLEDVYETGTAMGVYAERTAERYGFSREQQDEFAITSLKRAQQAIADGSFKREITSVSIKTRKEEIEIVQDEQPGKARLDKIPQLKPAFVKDGTVTAANSSSISDGAAALVLMKQSKAEALGLKPQARIIAHSTHSQEPEWFTTAPVAAIQKVFEKSGWQKDEVDLYEINEAFATVTMAAMHDLQLDHNKVNIHGGACALGHPVGASGARLIVTLLAALQKNNLTKGIASLCIGGGEATAIAIERLN